MRMLPWDDDVPLRGPETPHNDGHIEWLICYLLTVRKRYGNTRVVADVKWGASALRESTDGGGPRVNP